MQAARVYSQRKVQAVSIMQEAAKTYSTMAVASLHKVRATQLMALRKSFRDQMKIIVAKNRLAYLALGKAGLEGIEGLQAELKGQSAFIFTNMSPFRLYLVLEKGKVNLPARAGDAATGDILVPAGNTGLPPGPVISEFKEIGVATRIDTGSVWVTKDTLVAKRGDAITPKMAGLLSRLGIKPIRAGMSIALAYSGGILLKGPDVAIDLDEYRTLTASAHSAALKVAIASAYPAREVLPLLLITGLQDALRLAEASAYPTKETGPLLLSRAQTEASLLLSRLRDKGYKAA